MDTAPVLESIAKLMPGLPDSSVEDQLVTFDVLVGVSAPSMRPTAARMLDEAAAACPEGPRRQRLLQAAAAVIAGLPCALTPAGLSGQQAAAASTITQAEWDARPPLPPPPGEEDDVEEDFLESPPPALPDLPVRQFFPGLVARAAQAFADANGRTFCPGELLRLIDIDQSDTEVILHLQVRSARFNAAHQAILDNSGNAWLEPVPTVECLEDLCEAIARDLDHADEDPALDDDDLDRIESIRDEVEACESWLAEPGSGAAPICRTGAAAAKLFGSDHRLTLWLRLLFAAVRIAQRRLDA